MQLSYYDSLNLACFALFGKQHLCQQLCWLPRNSSATQEVCDSQNGLRRLIPYVGISLKPSLPVYLV